MVDGGVACPAAFTPPPAPVVDGGAPDGGASSQAGIEAHWRTVIDRLVGQYMRGDVLVYRGTAEGRAGQPTEAGSPALDGATIDQGSALAALSFWPATTNDWVLAPVPTAFAQGTLASLVIYGQAGQTMVLAQDQNDPSVTATSGIGGMWSGLFLVATCSDCAPSFWSRPSTIAFDLAASGAVSTVYTGFDGSTTVNTPVSTSASVQLGLVAPCNLTYQDLQTLNGSTGPNRVSDDPGLYNFALTGNEWVWHTNGSVVLIEPAVGMCNGRSFDYTIDLYINATDLTNFGVRNYSAAAPRTTCGA